MSVPQHIRNVFRHSKCIYDKAEINSALDQLAVAISYELSESDPIFLCVVVGGIIPVGCLLPRLDFPLSVDYVHATRYGNKFSGEEVVWKAKPRCDMKGRTVVIVDDILDGGLTLQAVKSYCESEGAKRVYTVVLVDKENARQPGGLKQADFTGLTLDAGFLFGFGLDYKGYLRNAPGIYAVSSEFLASESGAV
jgi:hypoxanthine phosphoribosyltransferase